MDEKNILVVVEGVPSFNMLVIKSNSIADIKKLLDQDYKNYYVKMMLNKEKELNVSNNNMALLSIWNIMDSPTIYLTKNDYSILGEIKTQLSELPVFLHFLTIGWLSKELVSNFRYMVSFPDDTSQINFWTYFGEDIVLATPSTKTNVEDETIGFTILPDIKTLDKLSVNPIKLDPILSGSEYWIARFLYDGTGRTHVFKSRQEAKDYLIRTLNKQLKDDEVISSYDVEDISLTKSELINDVSNTLSNKTNLESNLFTDKMIPFSMDFFHVKIQ